VENTLKVSVVVPTKNEEVTISKFLGWCDQGFKNAGVLGEVILMDFSSDNTPKIAQKHGAKVIRVESGGLGLAYKEAKKHISGEIVILGDADCTYDFRDIDKFIASIKSGNDFVMGSRFIGSIEAGSMPLHHRYFGSPLTTYVFRKILKIKVTDIHCGMRALTTKLFKTLPFFETGWEYASEMILMAARFGSKIDEIPINFYKDPPGRISHQKRDGFLTPFKAGIGTLRVIFTYGVERFITKPAFGLSVIGLSLTILKILFPAMLFRINIGNLGLSIFSMLTLSFFSLFTIGFILKSTNDWTGKYFAFYFRFFKPKNMFIISIILATLFLIFTFFCIVSYGFNLLNGESFSQSMSEIWIFSFIICYCFTVFTVAILHIENSNKLKGAVNQ
jgi:glycosyltransferase involved in cell wall biosynthesis